MIAAVVDGVLRQFEHGVRSPAAIGFAARLLEKQLGRRLNHSLIACIQTRRLRHTLQYARRRSPFYQTHFKATAGKLRHIDALKTLAELPFTTASDIRDWKRFLCVPEERLAAVFTTSGTTGEPKRVYFTSRDLQTLTNWGALGMRFRSPGRLVALIALPVGHGLWIGSGAAPRIIERAGGLPVPVGAGNPDETLAWIKRFAPNVVLS